jgi:tripartite-type tricarboxylate transporter receptor subunit TctC
VWFGFIGPARLPVPVAKRLEEEILVVVSDSEIEKNFADRLISKRVLNGAQFEQQVAQDLTSWKRLVDDLKIKLD